MIVTVNREIPAHRVCDKFWYGTGGVDGVLGYLSCEVAVDVDCGGDRAVAQGLGDGTQRHSY
jgi:hypothetical protein